MDKDHSSLPYGFIYLRYMCTDELRSSDGLFYDVLSNLVSQIEIAVDNSFSLEVVFELSCCIENMGDFVSDKQLLFARTAVLIS